MTAFKARDLGGGEDFAHTQEREFECRSGCGCLIFLMADSTVELTSNSVQYPIFLKRHCMLCDEARGNTRARPSQGNSNTRT
jgi:hypothetical protein